MTDQGKQQRFKPTESLVVSIAGTTVGELYKVDGKGIYFVYDKTWLAQGFNLSPITMKFDDKPQLAANLQTFNGLHGPFADSLPDGWGLLLMDRFFNATFGDGTARTATMLDRLAYIGDRGMGAFDYQPKAGYSELNGTLSIAELFTASQQVYAGETNEVLQQLRIAGGSPGGARPKAVIALSLDKREAISAFGEIPAGFDHWIIKFRAADEPIETGAIEYAYAQMARAAGIQMAESILLAQPIPNGQGERFFATKRFDREGDKKRHMITVAALMYADFRAPTMDYSDMLKLTFVLTKSAAEVEKMARLMIFNALAHNYDDHTKNFAFLCNEPAQKGESAHWIFAPAYDITFSQARGEHSTAFIGHGKPTRKIINELCRDYKFLKPNDYIDQTLDALKNWQTTFTNVNIPHQAGVEIFRTLEQLHKDFEGQATRKR